MDGVNYTSRQSKRDGKTVIKLEDRFTPKRSKFRFQFYEKVDFTKEYHSFLDTNVRLQEGS